MAEFDDAALERIRATMLSYLKPHIGHGDDMMIIWDDLTEWADGGPVTLTSDPASWGDWVAAYWHVRGVALQWAEADDQHELASDPSITVKLPPGGNPEWVPAAPGGDGTAVSGEELRQFNFFRTLVFQRYWAHDSLEVFIATLESDVPARELPSWIEAWETSGSKQWTPADLAPGIIWYPRGQASALRGDSLSGQD